MPSDDITTFACGFGRIAGQERPAPADQALGETDSATQGAEGQAMALAQAIAYTISEEAQDG
jgi:hypothetical protein